MTEVSQTIALTYEERCDIEFSIRVHIQVILADQLISEQHRLDPEAASPQIARLERLRRRILHEIEPELTQSDIDNAAAEAAARRK